MLRKLSLEVHTTGEALRICVCKFDTTDVVRCQSNKPLVRFTSLFCWRALLFVFGIRYI